MMGALSGSRADASSPAVSTKGFDPAREEDAAWGWLSTYSWARHHEEAQDIAFFADQMVDAFLAGAENARAADALRCSLGVGCDEAGACYATAHGKPEECGRGMTEGEHATRQGDAQKAPQ